MVDRADTPTATRRPDDTSSPLRPLKNTVLFAVALVGLASGIGSLATAGQLGRLTLQGVAAICVAYAGTDVFRYLRSQRRNFLKQELARRNEKLEQLSAEYRAFRDTTLSERQSNLETITRIAERQTLQYQEELQITVVIGLTDAEDRIIERHITRPTPFLIFRSFRPVLPAHAPPPSFEDLDMTIWVADQNTTRVTAIPIATATSGMRIVALFDPPATDELTWVVSYCPKGLWAPLRKGGLDFFAWDARSPLGRSDESTYTRLVIKFQFPGQGPCSVQERSGRGQISHERDTACISWHMDRPQGSRFEWDLAAPPVHPVIR